MTIKTSNCDQYQNLKFSYKLKNSNCNQLKNSKGDKTQNSNGDKTQKVKLFQNSKSLIVTKLKKKLKL